MAEIQKDKIHKIKPKQFATQQIVVGKYFSDIHNGKKYFQLATGLDDTQTQIIRFYKDTAIHLIQILIDEFELETNLKVNFK